MTTTSREQKRPTGSKASADTEANQAEADADADASPLAQAADIATTAVKQRIGQRIDKSAGDLGLLAQTLSLASQQLKGNIAAPYVGRLATEVERLSRFIENADPKAVLESAESLGKKKPLLFIGGALAVGIVGGRFIRSSAAAIKPDPGADDRTVEKAD